MCRGPMQAQCLWLQSLQAYLNLINSVVLVPLRSFIPSDSPSPAGLQGGELHSDFQSSLLPTLYPQQLLHMVLKLPFVEQETSHS